MREDTIKTTPCVSCGHQNSLLSKFCNGCGEKLSLDQQSLLPLETVSLSPAENFPTEQSTIPPLQIESRSIDCPYCGELIQSDAVTCLHCQSNLAEPEPALIAKEEDAPKRQTKECPHCAEEILQEALKCKHCASMVNQPLRKRTAQRAPVPESMPSFQTAQSQPYQAQVPGTVYISDRILKPDADPLMMALLSGCCIAGLGQIVIGQVGKGIVIIVLTLMILLVTGGFGIMLTWPLTVLDAFCVAGKLRRGQSVGKWECF